MPVSALPRYANTQPPLGVGINTGHPLAAGLRNCFLLLEGAGLVASNSMAIQAPISVGTGRPTWIPRAIHFGASLSGTQVEQIQTNARIGTSIARPQTLEAWVRIAGVTNGLAIGLLNNDTVTNGANVQGIGIGLGNTGMDNSGTNLIGINENVAFLSSGIAVPTGAPLYVQIGLVYYPTGTNSIFFINGRRVATADWGALHASSGATVNLYVGGYYQSSGAVNRGFTGDIALARHWDRALTDQEFAWLRREPYAMVNPTSRLLSRATPVIAPSSSWHTSLVKVWK